ncbi:DUF3152 domain-containing protein [Georgenia sp. TF02-10]|uniref:DUF3152 domain-containing protein n=1 Tax=Georgenia sp. TF02-10 TaxID=2917725 RepID=UPI001FA766C7|nr:DUF3152 domain-containing protein [Georgenia sp. TF02-10]UNX54160.1 DUF3152 domain-containing protein [Georgenia sp. TF02-10]
MSPTSWRRRAPAAAALALLAAAVPAAQAGTVAPAAPAAAAAIVAVPSTGTGLAVGRLVTAPAIGAPVRAAVTPPSASPARGPAAEGHPGHAPGPADRGRAGLGPVRTPAPPGDTAAADGPRLLAAAEAAVRQERARAGLTTAPIPSSASGTRHTVPGSVPAPRTDAPVRTVRVEVEEGLPVDAATFADYALTVLNDARGWAHDGTATFARTDGPADIRLVLASPALTDQLCAPLPTGGRLSCGTRDRAVLNAARFSDGAEPFLAAGGTTGEYRAYLVNHEVGHLVGQPHVGCPAPGRPAPVMLQQTLGLEGCTPNGWPAAE